MTCGWLVPVALGEKVIRRTVGCRPGPHELGWGPGAARVCRAAAHEGSVNTMTANQFPVEPRPGAPDPTADRVVPEDDLRGRALSRLKKKADFRTHLLIYLLVNGVIVLIWALTGSGFFWPLFVIAGWGIGLGANAVDTYLVDTPSEAQIESEMERLRRR